jgi:hypothetical protein
MIFWPSAIRYRLRELRDDLLNKNPSSNFWRFIVVFPTTFWLEDGKATDHQVRASARSGFSSFT